MALCATCHRAIYCWYDHPLLPIAQRVEDGALIQTFVMGLPWWTHYVPPTNGHDAMPLPSLRERVLLCAKCKQEQVWTPQGWACVNPDCPSRLDKA